MTESGKAGQERADVRATDEEVADALDDHQDAVRESALARAEADRIRRQADNLSKDAKQEEEAEIRAAERSVAAAADARLKDAQKERGAAVSKRAQADRIEELADAEKEQRRAERADEG